MPRPVIPVPAAGHLIVQEYAARLEDPNLTGDEQEEYSTVLLQLQNKIETGEPNGDTVRKCVDYLNRRWPGSAAAA